MAGNASLMGFEMESGGAASTEGWRMRHQGQMDGPKAAMGEREYLEAFSVFDQDNDGVVSKAELKEMMHSLGNDVSDEECRDIFTEAGVSLSKGITYAAFAKLMGLGSKKNDDDPEDELRHAFKLFDLDGDGFISPKEMEMALAKFGIKATPKEVDQIISEATHSGERRVNYDVFKRVMKGS